ncbi:MAG TPA: hypothetical protein VFM46_01400, partial [Pseudomonadales bacterium]|nr:hypothetical protein [Pseudomonadales bacterium]
LTLAADGRKDRVETLPTGAALVDLVKRILNNEVKGISGSTEDKMNVIFQDNVHMTPTGFYFISLVTYSAVYRSSPIGAVIPPKVEKETANDLQKIAWNFIQNYYSSDEPSKRDMKECRAYVADKISPTFGLIKDSPRAVSHYQELFRNENSERNPFRWPDPQFKKYPNP